VDFDADLVADGAVGEPRPQVVTVALPVQGLLDAGEDIADLHAAVPHQVDGLNHCLLEGGVPLAHLVARRAPVDAPPPVAAVAVEDEADVEGDGATGHESLVPRVGERVIGGLRTSLDEAACGREGDVGCPHVPPGHLYLQPQVPLGDAVLNPRDDLLHHLVGEPRDLPEELHLGGLLDHADVVHEGLGAPELGTLEGPGYLDPRRAPQVVPHAYPAPLPAEVGGDLVGDLLVVVVLLHRPNISDPGLLGVLGRGRGEGEYRVPLPRDEDVVLGVHQVRAPPPLDGQPRQVLEVLAGAVDDQVDLELPHLTLEALKPPPEVKIHFHLLISRSGREPGGLLTDGT